MIAPHQHQANVARMRELETKGYIFKVDANGYQVWHRKKYLGGASVKLPRAKPLHWQHRAANMKQNVAQALAIVDKYLASKKKRKKKPMMTVDEFQCPNCEKVHEKSVYCIAQQTLGNTLTFTCGCGHKFQVPD